MYDPKGKRLKDQWGKGDLANLKPSPSPINGAGLLAGWLLRILGGVVDRAKAERIMYQHWTQQSPVSSNKLSKQRSLSTYMHRLITVCLQPTLFSICTLYCTDARMDPSSICGSVIFLLQLNYLYLPFNNFKWSDIWYTENHHAWNLDVWSLCF